MKRGIWLGVLWLALGLSACTSIPAVTPVAAITTAPTATLIVLPSRTSTATSSPTALPTHTATSTSTVTPTPSPTMTFVPTATRPRATATSRPKPTSRPPSPVPIQMGAEEQQVVDLINQIRSQHGLTLLTVDSRLMSAAEGHSLDMAQHNFFAHEGSDGSTVEERLSRQRYHWNFYAEDLACGYASSSAAVQGWMDSPAHRDNLLAEKARQIGVGYVGDQGGDCHTYWTADFAAGR